VEDGAPVVKVPARRVRSGWGAVAVNLPAQGRIAALKGAAAEGGRGTEGAGAGYGRQAPGGRRGL